MAPATVTTTRPTAPGWPVTARSTCAWNGTSRRPGRCRPGPPTCSTASTRRCPGTTSPAASTRCRCATAACDGNRRKPPAGFPPRGDRRPRSPPVSCPASAAGRGRSRPASTLGDEAAHLALQGRQWYRSQAQHLVVEGLLVEAVAEFVLGLAAQVQQGAVADVVGQRLARPGDVAVDLVDHVDLRQRGMAGQVVDRLLPAPAVLVQPGVDHQAG